jgi:hypothetical protein
MQRLCGRGVIVLLTALSATPVLAQKANFGNLTIAPGFPAGAAQVAGQTGGSYSLPSIANSDRNKKPCIGFASETPDHILVLEKDFSNLTVQINSRGKDTTLLIKGPGNTIYCGDDTGLRKDASIEATNLKAGKYEIWVGSIEATQRWNYILTVREQPGRLR